MADGERLYFTIGPVQSFVAQSRRTRDLWASSYLLSHLADVAMRAIEQAGGNIILPYRERHKGTKSHQSAPTVQDGRWPNRFVAIVDNPKAEAEAAKLAMLNTWKTISEAVWRRFVEPVVSSGTGTKAIWDRQVSNFWEVSWVIARAPAPGDPDPLSLRKNWRVTPMTVEPGDHCTMMGSWQELSGHSRSQSRNSRERQDQFWKQIRSLRDVGELNLRMDERLCAVALVKRMFPLITKETIGIDLNAASWLSTPYIAAIPWLKRVCKQWPQQAQDYLALVKKHRKNWRREVPDGIASLQSLLQTDGGEFLRLDADFLHDTELANERDTPLDVSEADETRVREELVKGLGELHKEASKPSSFYAMLLMDGDSMGRLLSEARELSNGNGEVQITKALGTFAKKVSETVGANDGVTVYCGGDDVFAMLPVNNALPCAIALSKLYQSSFSECPEALRSKATISAAIVYCPFRAPLREVSATAHHLLDEVAKDQSGRNSLAVAVLKSSGLACQWSAPWDHVQENDVTILDRLVERLGGSRDSPGELSSGFLFQIRERYALLTNDPLTTPGRFGHLPEGMDASRILLAEYLRGRSRQGRADGDVQSEQAKETIELLMKVCQRAFRKDGKLHIDAETLGMDGALLVRFLAGEAQEVEQ